MRMLLITTAIFVFINIADGDILPKQDSLVVESTLTDTLIPAETTLVNPAEADASIQNETVRQAIVLHNRADSLLDCGEYSQARAAYNEALQLKNKLGDTLGEALCRFGLGKIAFYEALYSKSLRYLNAAEPVIAEIDLPCQLFDLHLTRGDIHSRRGQYEDALIEYRAALDRAIIIDNYHLIFLGYQSMGKLSRVRGRHEGALVNFTKALEAAPIASDSGYAYIDVSEVLTRQNEFALALAYQDSAVMKAESTADNVLLANAYGAKGNTYRQQGDFIKAIYCYEKQLNLIKEQNDDLARAKVMMNMAFIFEMQKRYAQALDFMEEVVIIFDELNNPELKKAEEYLRKLRNK